MTADKGMGVNRERLLTRHIGRIVRMHGARFLAVRAGQRTVAPLVEAVFGVGEFAVTPLRDLPRLLQQAPPEVVDAVGALDEELFLVLKAGKPLPETVWDSTWEEAAHWQLFARTELEQFQSLIANGPKGHKPRAFLSVHQARLVSGRGIFFQ